MSDTQPSPSAEQPKAAPAPEKPTAPKANKRKRDHRAERRRRKELRALKAKGKPKSAPKARRSTRPAKAKPKPAVSKRRVGERSWPPRYHRWGGKPGCAEEKCTRPGCKVVRCFFMGENSLRAPNPQIWFRLPDGKLLRRAPPCRPLPKEKAGRV